jgi:hypothetical protein
VKSRRLLSVAVLGLVSMAISLIPGAALADHGHDSARGKYTAFGTGFGIVDVQFNARSSPLGTDSKGTPAGGSGSSTRWCGAR